MSTGRDSRSASAASRAIQPIRQKPATTNASAEAIAAGLVAAVVTEPSAAAVISAVVDSGPTDSR